MNNKNSSSEKTRRKEQMNENMNKKKETEMNKIMKEMKKVIVKEK